MSRSNAELMLRHASAERRNCGCAVVCQPCALSCAEIAEEAARRCGEARTAAARDCPSLLLLIG